MPTIIPNVSKIVLTFLIFVNYYKDVLYFKLIVGIKEEISPEIKKGSRYRMS